MKNKPILIIKTGSTVPGLFTKKGDFEDWIAAGLGDSHPVWVADVKKGVVIPDAEQFAAAVITGSHHNVTEHLPWIEATASWLAQAACQGLPMLGICFGHQLLAYALGGEAGDNPRGGEYGVTTVNLHPSARQYPWLNQLPDKFPAQVFHKQTVLKLPPGAVSLAYSCKDECQMFVLGNTWGVQFHPEFDADVMRFYIHHYRQMLIDEGQDTDALLAQVCETPASAALLGKFAHLVLNKR
ncbi:MAG: glutamine amidotransferase [Anaerolineales bacterium]|nr:glutamine amidotransferase [Anaerolineales bacterium]